MGLHVVNTFQIGSSASVPFKLPRPDGGHPVPQNRKATRALLDVTIPVQNTTGGALTLKFGDLKSFLACLFASVTTSFGIKEREIIDNAEPFDRLRMLLRDLSGSDVLIQDATTKEWLELNTVTDSATFGSSIAAAGTTSVRVAFARPFTMEMLAHDNRNARLPGSDQLSQFMIEGVRGSSFSTYTAGWAQSGNVDCVLLYDLIPTRSNDWHPVPRYVHSEESGQFQTVRGGALLRCYERSFPLASTTLGEVSVEGNDGEKIQGPVHITRIQQDYAFRLPAGMESVSSVWTPLFTIEDGATLEDCPLAEQFRFKQEGSAVINPAKFTALIVPVAGTSFVEAGAKNLPSGPIGSSEKGEEIAHIVNADYARDANVSTTRAATSGFRILPPDARDAGIIPGLRVTKGGTTRENIPTSLANAVKQAESIAGAAGVQGVTERAAKAIPGLLQARIGGAANVAGRVIARKLR